MTARLPFGRLILSLFLTNAADGVSLTRVGEYPLSVDGCSAITYTGIDGLYYIVRDHAEDGRSKALPLLLGIDRKTGAVVSQLFGDPVTLGENTDSEGAAFDGVSRGLWISDEATPTVAEFRQDGTPTERSVPVPEIQRTRKRANNSLEALTLSPDGLTLWTANEQALSCDGELSDGNPAVTTVVRLMRFVRLTPYSDWTADGQWAYACDRCGGGTASQNGVSGLCALPDGSLLVLEREVSTKTWGRCRIYNVTPAALGKAPEVSSWDSLRGKANAAVNKGAPLIEMKGGFCDIIVYEGITLGPRLDDGSRAVYLVSDGGASRTTALVTANTISRLCALRLSGVYEPEVPLGWFLQ